MGGKKSNQVNRWLSKAFKSVRTWQLVIILIPLLFFTATLLRFDHLRMVELRQAVIAADEKGNQEEITQTLIDLKEFVDSHTVVNVVEENGVQSIIFGTGTFYLESQYIRDATAALEAAANNSEVDDSNPNGNIYAAVAAICQPQAIANGWQWSDQPYLDCWMNELSKYPESDIQDNQITADIPPTSLYRRSYASPIFSLTPAGIAIIACIVLTVVIIIRLIIWVALKISLLFFK